MPKRKYIFTPLEIAILKMAKKAGYNHIYRENDMIHFARELSLHGSYWNEGFDQQFTAITNGKEFAIDEILY